MIMRVLAGCETFIILKEEVPTGRFLSVAFVVSLGGQ